MNNNVDDETVVSKEADSESIIEGDPSEPKTSTTSKVKDKASKKKLLKHVGRNLIGPILMGVGWLLLLLLGLSVILTIVNVVTSYVNSFENLFSDQSDEEKMFIKALPNYMYVEEREPEEGVNTDSFKAASIEIISDLKSASAAPTYYFGYDTRFDLKKEDVFRSGLSDNKKALNDICILAYAGLVQIDGGESPRSFLQVVSNKYEELEYEDYNEFADEIINTDSRNICPDMSLIKDPKLADEEKLETYANILSINLAKKAGEFKFDWNTYAKFLEKFYIIERYGENPEVFAEGESKEKLLKTYISEIRQYFDIVRMEFHEEFVEKSRTGAGEDSSFSKLSNVYGSSKCSYLEAFDNNHPFVIAKGIDSNKIYSIYDGKVIYVNKNQSNLYSNYDLKTKKCLCDGSKCGNYGGNQIKIEFKLDDMSYIATYSHLDEVYVEEGTTVKKGDLIGTEGSTGCTNFKNLQLELEDQYGYKMDPSEIIETCSSMIDTYNSCNFQNITISDNEKSSSFYEYIKQELYRNYKNSIDNNELLKAETVILATKVLKENNYQVGLDMFNKKYEEQEIPDTYDKKLTKAINEVLGETLLYADRFANVKISNTCARTEKDKAANKVYNEFCVKSALEMDKTYDEMLRVFYPNFTLAKNYCLDYASKINIYKLDNDKPLLRGRIVDKEKLDSKLKTRLESVTFGSRASAVEAARFLTLGYEYRIPYKNGGKYFEEGFNANWSTDGLDSSGFVSWCLLNAKTKIRRTLNIKELVGNTSGSLKINEDLYKYYDQIQVGDLAYQESRIGIIIGKNNGILYVAESDAKKGLIVSTITSYGKSESNYTNIYFADDYYETNGNITNMW